MKEKENIENKNRRNKVEVRLSDDEYAKLKRDSIITNKSMSEVIREYMNKGVIKQKPDTRFYDVMRYMTKIYLELKKISDNSLKNNKTDIEKFKKCEKKWRNFENEVRTKFLNEPK